MSPVQEEKARYYQDSSTARQAAVLALLMPKADEWHVHFIKRPSHPKDKHSGQIAFPGGGLEDQDISLESCALRETQEEIGIAADEITVIGSLTKLYVYASNNLVSPYVGYISQSMKYEIQPSEVEKVITAPMSYFDNKDLIKSTSFSVRGHKLEEVPYYDLYGETLWGATAMMMSELIHIWNQTK